LGGRVTVSYRPAPGGDEFDGSVKPEVSQHRKEEDQASGESGLRFFFARSMGFPEIIRKPYQSRVSHGDHWRNRKASRGTLGNAVTFF
jgi:hypothetical protein